MTSKKLLLPEPVNRKTRKKKKNTKETSSNRKYNLPFSTRADNLTYNQKNEALGLILIGLSAFSLSLTHYLGSSEIPTILNFAVIQIGMGVYILPLLIGLIGIQKFIDRPFENLAWRISGCIGTMVFGLGLLGLEGGKIGISTSIFFAKYFGYIPSKILFFFLLLSSLVFALDVLYKDVLAAAVIITSIIAKFLFLLWSLVLTLTSMFIEAVKTTLRLFSSIYNRVSIAINNSKVERNYIDYRSDNNADTNIAPDEKHEKDEKDENMIPQPQSWQTTVENKNSTTLSKPQTIDSSLLQPQETSAPPETTTRQESEELDENTEMRVMVVLDSENNDCSQTKQELDEETDEEDEEDEALYLDDNPIDVEIKNSELAEITNLSINPYLSSQLPPLDLLRIPPPRDNADVQTDLSLRSALLLKTLDDFAIKANITAIVEGPAVSRFELKPAPGVKVAKITSLADDIALALSAQSIRIEAPIPGKPALGIEIPNTNPSPVYFYDLLKNDRFIKSPTLLNLALGVTISGKAVFADLTEMPHLLIAGSTGSGKSVCVNTIIASILYKARADQVKFVMIDPKMVELSSYNGIPHLISPVVTDPSKAAGALMWAVEEMERRYELLAACGARKISSYNENIDQLKTEIDSSLEPMPFIVIIIDELADLMMTASAEVEGSICRLAQMARAVGIHLVIATQRPSVNVLTGIIKANLPTRIAFSVTSAIDSRTILDSKGAESLLGKGDMLFIPKGRNKPIRLQGAFISDRELQDITDFVKSQGTPEYMEISPDNIEDNDTLNEDDSQDGDPDSVLLDRIMSFLETQEKISTSMLQRKFRIGYNRAARIMDQLEEKNLVSPLDGSNKRKVLFGRSGNQI